MEENKKIAEVLKGIYDSLTGEQKEKAKKCKTTDELLKLAGEEGIELPDEVLDAAAGGVIVDIKDGTFSAFDGDGEYIGNVWGREAAEKIAAEHNVSTAETDYQGLERMRQAARERRNRSC